jgi:hypothetical protein
MLPHQTLQAWWSQTGTGIATQPTPECQIEALEARYGISLPDDFRAYLKESAPREENWDDNDGNWWPVNRIRNILEEYPSAVSEPIASNASQHLVFIDYSIWSWAWSISCADDNTRGQIALIGGPEEYYVANSFAEFINRYVDDWGSLTFPQSADTNLGELAPAQVKRGFWSWLRRG